MNIAVASVLCVFFKLRQEATPIRGFGNGGSVSILLLIPNPIECRIAIGGVAVVMLGVGASLTLYARRYVARNGLARD